jgi:hypothetical protein
MAAVTKSKELYYCLLLFYYMSRNQYTPLKLCCGGHNDNHFIGGGNWSTRINHHPDKLHHIMLYRVQLAIKMAAITKNKELYYCLLLFYYMSK